MHAANAFCLRNEFARNIHARKVQVQCIFLMYSAMHSAHKIDCVTRSAHAT